MEVGLSIVRESCVSTTSAFIDENNPGNSEAKKPSDSYVQSFARGLAVIKAFSAERPAQSLTEVAEAAGLTRAGARRILLTLVHLGYVRVDGRQFRLTPKILDLGFAYLSSTPFWNAAEPIVEALAEEVRQSCSIAVLDGNEIVYVLRVPTRKIMALNLSIGSRLPAINTSMGRVLLSGLTEAELDAVISTSKPSPETESTVVDAQELKKIIAVTRRQGWALVNQELELGLISVAAPIRDRNGRVIAAINTSGISDGAGSEDRMKQFIEPLKQAADKISEVIAMRV